MTTARCSDRPALNIHDDKLLKISIMVSWFSFLIGVYERWSTTKTLKYSGSLFMIALPASLMLNKTIITDHSQAFLAFIGGFDDIVRYFLKLEFYSQLIPARIWAKYLWVYSIYHLRFSVIFVPPLTHQFSFIQEGSQMSSPILSFRLGAN